MFTDMVGYSALSQRDDKLALELLEEHQRLLREIFPRFHGTEIKTIGDAFLVEFNSALAAAQCAIEIQRALAHRNADAPSQRQIQVRIGVHIGDVEHRGGDVYGDGVNIASRIEPLAGAGGICVSMDVERQIRNAVETRFEKLAPTDLKNISVPMDLFRIVLPWEKQPARAAPSQTTPKGRSNRGLWIAALIIAVVAFAGLYVFSHRSSWAGFGSAAIPEKSVAVLPFENLSEEKANAFFTDGVQDEILTDLAKIADLKVISRTSVMQYKSGVARNLRKIGEELGVAHVVEGSVQRAANRIRVNAQLIDARNDAHLWAQTYDRDLADVFAIQSEIAKAIADQLQAKLSPNEKAAIEQPPTADITAFDLYTRANNVVLANSFSVADRQNLRQAADLLNQALARDPSFFLAYCRLASAHAQLYFLGDHTPAQLALAEAAVQAAIRLRPDAGEAHLARAENFYRGYLDFDGALAELDIARRTLPNDPRVFELTGYVLRRRGKHEEGLQYQQRALQLDPRNFFTLQQIALSYVVLRRYSEEAAVLDRGLAIKPDDVETKVARALVDFDWKADTRPLRQTIDSIRTKNPGSMQSVADSWFNYALAQRDPAAASQALLALGENTFGMDASQIGEFTRSFGEGLIARMMRDEVKARSFFTAARAEQEKSVESKVDYGPALCVLGLIDAALGRKEEALREGRRAVELVPVEKDSLNGAAMIEYLALIAAWVGEKDLACEQLAIATRLPGSLSYGQLKLLPYWDPLRGDPRFEKIVASLAPKATGK